jgi:hypothetical protein
MPTISFCNSIVSDRGEHISQPFGYLPLKVEELLLAEDIERNGGHTAFLDFAG